MIIYNRFSKITSLNKFSEKKKKYFNKQSVKKKTLQLQRFTSLNDFSENHNLRMS